MYKVPGSTWLLVFLIGKMLGALGIGRLIINPIYTSGVGPSIPRVFLHFPYEFPMMLVIHGVKYAHGACITSTQISHIAMSSSMRIVKKCLPTMDSCLAWAQGVTLLMFEWSSRF